MDWLCLDMIQTYRQQKLFAKIKPDKDCSGPFSSRGPKKCQSYFKSFANFFVSICECFGHPVYSGRSGGAFLLFNAIHKFHSLPLFFLLLSHQPSSFSFSVLAIGESQLKLNLLNFIILWTMFKYALHSIGYVLTTPGQRST